MKAATRITLFFLLFAHFGLTAEAQPRRNGNASGPSTGGVISGTVVSADDQSAIPTATVAIWSATDSSLVTGSVTGEDGRFEIGGLRPGGYYARVSFVGFRSLEVPDIRLRRGDMNALLGRLALESNSQLMDEVEITAERDFIEVGIDRTVYNTRDQLVSAGGTASDVLENIPSVEVDIDGNISLRGSQNVAVLINGRPSPMTGDALISYLQGLPGDMIDRVEVIPNPSAKYEPDGMAGILNIELKKDRDVGINGGVSVSAATQGRYNGSGTINFQKGKVGLFTSYGLSHYSRESGGWRFYQNRLSNPLTTLDQESDNERLGSSHNLNSSIDYNFNKQNALTLSGMLSLRNGDNDGFTAYEELYDDEILFNRFDRTTLGDNSDLSTEYRLAYRRTVEPGKNELNLEVEFEQEWDDEDGEYIEELFNLEAISEGTIAEQQADFQKENNREMGIQVDYMRPLGGDVRMEAGLRSEIEQLNSKYFSETFDTESGAFLPDVNRINTFNYDQAVNAAYGILATELGKFGFQVGVRLEQAFTTFELETTNESFDNNYFSAFPSAYVTYALTDRATLKGAYSKRINRPRTGGRFNQLNPFDTNEDPYFRFIGNPYLNPEYVHAFELSYTQFTETLSLTLTPYYRYTVDEIRFYQDVDEAGVSTTTFRNFDTSNSWGAEVIATYKRGRRFNAYTSFNAYKVVTDGSNVDTGLSNNAIGFSTRTNATFNVSPTLDVQFSYYYRAPMDIEGGRMASRQSANMAVRQKLFNDRANLSLRFSDVFGTMGFAMVRENQRFFQEINRSFQAQGVGINFSYNFGKPIKQNRRSRGGAERQAGPDEVDMSM